MDYNDQSVGLCYFCVFFRYKQYTYLMMITNAIQGIVLMGIGILGLLEEVQLLVFSTPITLSFICLGSLVVFGLILQLIFLMRNSVLYIGRMMVVVNILTSLFDLSSGIILILSCFMKLTFIEFNDTQQSFSETQRTILLIISILIIIVSLYGFWMTFLQYQTIIPLQEQLQQEFQVVPVISLRQAVARKLSKNFIGELTPNGNGRMNRLARGDSTLEQSQPLQRMQSKQFMQIEQNEPYANQRSEKLIKVNDNLAPYNEFYTISSNTMRHPQQTDELQTLRKQKTPRATQIKQQQES
ncbi:unnamed protein product (macronuclear) [Paramecium tetraurelia]|uniref:Transmembrane protein n=1 Tax=Paramecium tetraurelia TaxID=5888 RepID=A0E616_PARTE|nr:uncharacterized protein GSPATT00003596001 [Paramecium tetraurelia]CAK90733.1 unnamed protein product [Paramecium tetraurelia]|eukprot:XP_001458130.1 hypothetical protein (macronuclear) [Paramecium tetraurelia strain d4-2]